MKNYIIDRITDKPCRNDIKKNTEIVTLRSTIKTTKIGFSSWDGWVKEMQQNQNNRRNPNMKNIVKIDHETIKTTFDRIRNEQLLPYEHMHFDRRDGDIPLMIPHSWGSAIEDWLITHNYLPTNIYDINGNPVKIG